MLRSCALTSKALFYVFRKYIIEDDEKSVCVYSGNYSKEICGYYLYYPSKYKYDRAKVYWVIAAWPKNPIYKSQEEWFIRFQILLDEQYLSEHE